MFTAFFSDFKGKEDILVDDAFPTKHLESIFVSNDYSSNEFCEKDVKKKHFLFLLELSNMNLTKKMVFLFSLVKVQFQMMLNIHFPLRRIRLK